MEELDRDIAITSLKAMFNGNHFSICDFDKVAELLGVCVPSITKKRLGPLHCIRWGDMPDHVREYVFQVCCDLFDMPTTEFKLVRGQYRIVEPRKGIMKLLGGSQ